MKFVILLGILLIFLAKSEGLKCYHCDGNECKNLQNSNLWECLISNSACFKRNSKTGNYLY